MKKKTPRKIEGVIERVYDDDVDYALASASMVFSAPYIPITGTKTSVFSTETAVSADFTELLTVVHRIESNVQRNTERLKKIEGKIDVLNRMSAIDDTVEDSQNDEGANEVLDVTDEVAREMILEYMKTNERAWAEDISIALKLDFGLVMRITSELVREGKLSDEPTTE